MVEEDHDAVGRDVGGVEDGQDDRVEVVRSLDGILIILSISFNFCIWLRGIPPKNTIKTMPMATTRMAAKTRVA